MESPQRGKTTGYGKIHKARTSHKPITLWLKDHPLTYKPCIWKPVSHCQPRGCTKRALRVRQEESPLIAGLLRNMDYRIETTSMIRDEAELVNTFTIIWARCYGKSTKGEGKLSARRTVSKRTRFLFLFSFYFSLFFFYSLLYSSFSLFMSSQHSRSPTWLLLLYYINHYVAHPTYIRLSPPSLFPIETQKREEWGWEPTPISAVVWRCDVGVISWGGSLVMWLDLSLTLG